MSWSSSFSVSAQLAACTQHDRSYTSACYHSFSMMQFCLRVLTKEREDYDQTYLNASYSLPNKAVAIFNLIISSVPS